MAGRVLWCLCGLAAMVLGAGVVGLGIEGTLDWSAVPLALACMASGARSIVMESRGPPRGRVADDLAWTWTPW